MDTVDHYINIADKWLERNIWKVVISIVLVVAVIEVSKSYWITLWLK
jgi:hypothetical protein